MRRSFVPVLGVLVVLIAGIVVGGCQSTPTAAPTSAPAAPKAAEPTKAAAPAAAPTTAAAPAATAAPAAATTNFPEKGKTIQIIVHWAAGGANDVAARIVQPLLEKEMGASVEVVNKAGASGQVGMTFLSQAKPDGYTIGNLNFPSAIITTVDPDRKATYKRDSFQPLAMHQFDPGVWAVKPDSPYKTLKDLFDAAKASPKKIRVADSGIQSDDHFGILQAQKVGNAQFAIVHFSEGFTPGYAAFLGGHVEVMSANVGELFAQHKNGEARILGVMDKQRSKFLPDVPTFEEAGVKVYSASTRGFGAPSGMPKPVVDKYTTALKKVMDDSEHIKKMDEMGLSIRYLNPDQFNAEWEEAEKMYKDLLPLSKEK